MPGYDLTDTIVAPATPLAASAIGIVRLSGPQAWEVARGLLQGVPDSIEPQRAYLARIVVGENTNDTCVALFWQAPSSYTGEDIAELMLHGSPLLLRQVLARCQAAGARLAEPGEFTYRAYMNGKLDLGQAEAVQELISAPTAKSLELAAAQLAGLPGKRIYGWIEKLQTLLAGIEVIHDYAADDLDATLDPETLLTTTKLSLQLQQQIKAMDAALEATRRSEQLRSGITVAICGPPNVGKSTLFNALLGHERALTAPEPGTTRDYLSETLETSGVRLTLVDTAGYREAGDAVEAAGVVRAAEWARGADRVLWVTAADNEQSTGTALEVMADAIHVVTRCDLLSEWPAASSNGHADPFYVSGLTGRGISELWNALLTSGSEMGEGAIASLGKRQAQGVQFTREALVAAVATLESGMPLDAAVADIYAALEQLHGTFEQADRNLVIEQVFSGFCVGK